MKAQLRPDGGLLVPKRAEGPGATVGDGLVRAGPGSADWEVWAPHAGIVHASCGGPATPIVWGMPSEADRARTPDQGRVVFGGCCLEEPLRHWTCEACNTDLDPDQLAQP